VGKRQACYSCFTLQVKRPVYSGIRKQTTIRADQHHGSCRPHARSISLSSLCSSVLQRLDRLISVASVSVSPTTPFRRLGLWVQQPRLYSRRHLRLRHLIMRAMVRDNPIFVFDQKSLSRTSQGKIWYYEWRQFRMCSPNPP